ncbi:hypothetical protein N7520_007945 [Penicillium odoratum]|uniref:uncharacterized protein n=1 Tax=Penicillium odoratum TaxID=1167516 RepID=UPI002546B56C|nr:uncharacterized protein N7520_007945 [Penicillium odoratum]KAJ5760789.1 hypothetical protein N7520_007945 [Penicillium odoratum]
MKFNIAFALAAALYLAPNAVAWNLPGLGKRQDATPTSQIASSSEPTGTFPSGSFGGGEGGSFPSDGAQPSGSFGGSGGHGHGSGSQQSGRPGPRPSGAASSGAVPSGSFGGGESGGAQPSGTVGGTSGGGSGGASPSGAPHSGGGSGGFGGGQSTFVTVPAGPTATPEASSQSQGESSEGEKDQRIHARQFRAIQV